MSYILDALRKAEEERHLGRPPNPIAASTPTKPVQQRLWLWLGAGLGLGFNAALLAYLLLVKPQPPSPIATTASTALEPKASERTASDVKPAPSITSQPAAPAQGAPAASPESATARSVSPTPSPGASRKTPGGAPLAGPLLHPSAIANQERRRKAPKPPPGPSVSIGREPPPLLEAIPANARRGAPAFNLDIHVYSPNAEKRFVVVGGQRYREGEQMGNGTVLEAVTPTGATLRQGNRRFRLSLPR